MDYSKFLYERSKKEREARKSQKIIEVKEIQLQLKTADYHLQFKIKNARKWLEEGMKVNVRIQLKGREIDYRDIARGQMEGIFDKLQDLAILESMPKMDGKAMVMVLAPQSMHKEQPKPVVESRPPRPAESKPAQPTKAEPVKADLPKDQPPSP
jgi:translation initiation factor IF-3